MENIGSIIYSYWELRRSFSTDACVNERGKKSENIMEIETSTIIKI